MNKFLAILWVLIIAGGAIIAISIFKPDTKPEDKISISETEEKAEKQTKTISTKEQKNFNQLIAFGDSELENSLYEKAIYYYKQASELNPSSSEALIKLGNAYLKNNQEDQAKKTFFSASRLNPTSLDAKIGSVQADIAGKNLESAKNTIWNLDENEATIKYYKAIILILANQFDEAKTRLEELIKLPKENFPEITTKAEKFLEKYAIYESFVESPDSFLKVLLAQALTENSENHSAILLLFTVLDKESNYRDAWTLLGYNYLITDQPKEAIDALLQAKTLEPENPKILFFLGLAYFADNQVDPAISYLKAADKNGYEPKDQINLKLGDLYTLKQEYQKAQTSYEDVLKENQQNLQVYVRAIWLSIDKLNQPDKALELAQQAVEKHPKNAMSYNLKGWAYTALGKYKDGKDYLDRALAIDPKLDAIHLNLGWLYEKKGSTKLAKEYYKKAYVLGRGNSIGNQAAIRFNKLTEKELNQYYQANLASP